MRRTLSESEVLPKLAEPIRYSPELPGSLADLIQSVKAQKLEGLVAKRSTSVYEPGQRSGAWLKMRINQGQEFVIGGYTVGGATFDALIFGYYEGDDLVYVARTRNGFTPSLRQELMKKFRAIRISQTRFKPILDLTPNLQMGILLKREIVCCLLQQTTITTAGNRARKSTAGAV